MKNKIAIGALVTIGAVVLTYLLKNKKGKGKMEAKKPSGRKHHRTDVFAHAKEMSL